MESWGGGLCLDCGVGGKHSLAAPLFSTSAHLSLPWAGIQLQDLFANQQTRQQTKSCVCSAATSPAGGWGASKSSSGLRSTWHLGSGGVRATRLAVQATLPSTPAVATVGIRGRHGSHKLSTCPLPSSSRRPMWNTGHTLLPGLRAGNPFKELSRSLALPEWTARLVYALPLQPQGGSGGQELSAEPSSWPPSGTSVGQSFSPSCLPV